MSNQAINQTVVHINHKVNYISQSTKVFSLYFYCVASHGIRVARTLDSVKGKNQRVKHKDLTQGLKVVALGYKEIL